MDKTKEFKNDVTSFFFYMWNMWSMEECEKVFKHSNCNWQHFWDKWNGFCNREGCRGGAIEPFFAELSDDNRDLLVKRAIEMYDGRSKRKE